MSDMDELISSFGLPGESHHHHAHGQSQGMYSPLGMSGGFGLGVGVEGGGFGMGVDPFGEYWDAHEQQQQCGNGGGHGPGGMVMESAAVGAVAVKKEERWEEGYRHV